MATPANQADFLGGGGTLNPFGEGTAPPQTLEEVDAMEAARRARIQQQAQQNASNNAAFQRETSGRPTDTASGYLYNADGSQMTPDQYDAYAKAHHLGQYGNSFAHNLVRDPVTMGVLAAPFAVTGAGLAVGGAPALGFGSAPAIGGAAAPAITTGGAMTAPTMAAPAAAAGAAGAAGAAPAAAAAGTPWYSGLAGKAIEGAVGAAGILGINALTNPGASSPAAKALLDKQNQLAGEAQGRQEQAARQTYDMLGQRMLAFAPYNNMMAHLYGPQAALTPQTAAQMVQNPVAPNLDPSLINYQGADPQKQAQVEDYLRRLKEYQQAEASRQQMMTAFPSPQSNATPAAPITPLPAKRYF